MDSAIEADFLHLRTKLKKIEQQYNPKDENLHFDPIARADGALLAALLNLAQEGLKEVRKHHAYFVDPSHRLYDDGMFWYDCLLLIKAAAIGIADEGTQGSISSEVVGALLEVMVEIGEYSTIMQGDDMSKRNMEALGETLLTFYGENTVELARRKSREVGAGATWLVDEAVSRVKELRPRNRGLPSGDSATPAAPSVSRERSEKSAIQKNFPALDAESLDAIFVRVYGLSPEEERTFPLTGPMSDFFALVKSYADFNYHHRNDDLRIVYPIAREAIGEFEINSEGTSVWMSFILALKELYNLSDSDLKKTLKKITVRK